MKPTRASATVSRRETGVTVRPATRTAGASSVSIFSTSGIGGPPYWIMKIVMSPRSRSADEILPKVPPWPNRLFCASKAKPYCCGNRPVCFVVICRTACADAP